MSLVKNKSVVAGVTNPWKWYVDFYVSLQNKQELLQVLGRGNTDFKSVLHTLTHALDVIPEPNSVVLWNTTNMNDVYDDYMCSGLGYCSWLFKTTYKNTPDFYINLNKTQSGFDTLLCLPESNSTVETDYINLYDEEMIDWVRFADSVYINCFKWTMTDTDTPSLYVKEDMDFPYSFTH
jgi:hypothetical protein